MSVIGPRGFSRMAPVQRPWAVPMAVAGSGARPVRPAMRLEAWGGALGDRARSFWDGLKFTLSGLWGRSSEPRGGAASYTVQAGDSLSAIAGRLLGDPNRWREIYDQNRAQIGDNPNLIVPGQVLTMPGGQAAPAPAPAAPPASAGGTYTVRPGDTLGRVAAATLGDANRWREIFDANRDQLDNPNLIFPGTVLKVPGGASAPAPAAAPQAPSGKLAWPIHGTITSRFGLRRDPVTGAPGNNHTGLDIAAATGTPIRTPLPGRVTYAGWNSGYGNHVAVDHGNGLVTTYSHMSGIDVSVGQQIPAGQVVGRVGSTGKSTGPHLHFEVKRNGSFVDPQTMLA